MFHLKDIHVGCKTYSERRLTGSQGSCDLLSKMSIKITIPVGLVRLEHGTIHGAEARGAPLGPEWSLLSILKSSTWLVFSAFPSHQ